MAATSDDENEWRVVTSQCGDDNDLPPLVPESDNDTDEEEEADGGNSANQSPQFAITDLEPMMSSGSRVAE